MNNIFYCCGLSILLLGCSEVVQPTPPPRPLSVNEAYEQLPKDTFSVKHGSYAAQILLNKTNGAIKKDVPLIIASFVDSNDLNYTTGLGRLLAEQFSTQFINNGYKVVELLLRENLFITKKGGEFLLSREIKNLSLKQHNAQAALVGTYVTGANEVFINAKVVDISSNVIISSLDFTIPLDPNVIKMLAKNELQPSSTKECVN
jgi:TolB-like protein